MPDNLHFQWYAIQTQSRFEKIVRDELSSRGIECLLPLCTRISRWKGRQKRIEWPLFAGYCFGRFGLDQRMDVIHTTGVVQIIGSVHAAVPIPEEEITAIQRLIQSGSHYETCPYHVEKGLRVTVTGGALQGLHGKFVRTASACRLIIAVNLIQQAASVDIDAEEIALAEGPMSLAFRVA